MTLSPSRHGLRADVDRAARRIEASDGFPAAYVGLARTAAGRLAASSPRRGDVRGAVADLEEHATISARAPVDAPNRALTAAKKVVGKAVFFSAHHLAAQVTAMGWSTVWLGMAASERLEHLERRLTTSEESLRDDLDQLRARIELLERASGDPRDGSRG